ncbi:PQQ-binding-like beta-propeller repeat protein [Thermocrispum sp.]|uniref:PQQ-binding-like beta-propeller repeat protein n=1 Tax=Thermocrispum agreste TaxID=37925 RepID=A0A2W4JP06_9PSEU|nr:PQQ-binding-like beta-propeller repeat protein [Thermocrispum sp.]PZN00019.1 MAG: hypothetical protein DIU77_04515 [Thermocrispum agreste]
MPGSREPHKRTGTRSPWTRPRDRIAAAIIVVLVVVVGAVVWAQSDSRATSRSTARPVPALPEPAQPPERLTEAWRAPSPATVVPVAHGSTVVTAADGEVTGRDAETGRERWHYARDLPLCTVAEAWGSVVVVHSKSAGCSEVSRFDITTGRLRAQRNGDAEFGTRLLSDGTHVLATGRKLLNVWSRELIRTMEYGRVPTPVEPNRQHPPGCTATSESGGGQVETSPPPEQERRCTPDPARPPRADCVLNSMTLAVGKIAVTERCAGDRADWLTVIGTTNEKDGENRTDEPKVLLSAELPGPDGRVVAVARDDEPRAAVVLPHSRQMLIYAKPGKLVHQYRLTMPADELLAAHDAGTPRTTNGVSSVLWDTGSATLALDATTLQPRWTLPDTRGTGVLWAGSVVVPIDGGVAVIDERTGVASNTIAVDRGDYQGPVRLGRVGPVLLEQRGDTLVAFR